MKVDNRRYDTDEIRRTRPVESVAASYGVALRREGKAFVGLCPFHADHQTPNFYVYPASRRWWCYVCKQGGDVIELVRRIENISFLEACEKLAGAPASEVQPVPPERRQLPRVGWECLSPSQQMLMDTAAASYRGRLWDTPPAVDWLRQRGLEVETIRTWGLGYCDGVTFRDFMLRDRWLTRLAFGLGLLRSHRDDGAEAEPYETMAGRLVIPEYRAGQRHLVHRAAGREPTRLQAGRGTR
jgi:DNA primase